MSKNHVLKPWIPLLVLALILPLAACRRQAPISNVIDMPVSGARSGSLTKEKAKEVILAACRKFGWAAREIEPGLIRADYAARSHTATIEIPFSSTRYSIIYKHSTNLKYNAQRQTIHNQYNHWISNLRQEIDTNMAYK
jgi:hypothetical protein